MLLAAILAATVAATPAPKSLAPLKIIGSVRSTPLCSTLSKTIVPAIAALIENDGIIDKAPPIFNSMYRHQLTDSWRDTSPHFFLDIARLEYLIGPLAANIKRIDNLLTDKNAFPQNPKSDDERRLAQMRDTLKTVEQEQQKALNTISGYDATALEWNMIDENVPGNWHGAFSNAPSPSNPIAQKSSGDPRFGSSPLGQTATLTRNPYSPVAQDIVAARSDGLAAESSAAAVISPIAASCETK